MSKKEKLVVRFLSSPKDFTWNELVSLLNYFDFFEFKKGKTAGSRRAFIHAKTNQIIRLHEPHPQNIIKQYQLKEVREILGL